MSKPVYGSATAATSLSRRMLAHAAPDQPGAPCCHEGAVKTVLHPPPLAPNCCNFDPEGGPLSFQTDSLERAPALVSFSDVPPTATTVGSDAGASGRPGAVLPFATKSQLR